MKTRISLPIVAQVVVIVAVCTVWRGGETPVSLASSPPYVITCSACSPTPPASGPAPGEAYTELPLGLYTYNQTDMSIAGPMPIVVRRIYRSNDMQTNGQPYVGSFGVGTELNYYLWLYSPSEVAGAGYTSVALILPNGGRVPFNRTSSCTQSGCTDYTDAAFTSNTIPDSVFFGATITYTNGGAFGSPGWNLRLKNGTVYYFPLGAPLWSVFDRNNNGVYLTWVTGPTGKPLLTDISATSDRRYATISYTGSLVSQITDNNGHDAYYYYNSSNQMTSFTDTDGNTTGFGWASAGSPNITSISDPAGNITQMSYDSSSRLTQLSFGNPDTGYSGTIYSQSYGLSPSGQMMVSDVDGASNTTNFIYDSYNPSFNDGNTQSDGDPYGYVVGVQRAFTQTAEEDTSFGRAAGNDLIEYQDEATNTSYGRTTYYTYDAMGNTLSVTRNNGGNPTATTSYTYDPTFNQVTSITDPNGNVSHIGYDSYGNATSSTDAMKNQSTATYNSIGEPLTTTDPMGNTTHFAYDSYGDLSSVTDPLNNTTSYAYDALGRLTSITDPLGNTSNIAYDARNNVTSVTDPLGHTTSFQYDPLGRSKQITDANGNSTTDGYFDPFGTRSQCDALNNCTLYTYNTVGEMVSSQDPLGSTLDFNYDGLGRATSVSSSGSSSSTFTYDALNRITQISGSPLSQLSFTYDALDHLEYEGEAAGSLSYNYDNDGNRLSMTPAPTGGLTVPTTGYLYDADNRLISLTNGPLSASISYDDDSRRTELSLPNGVTTNYGYDADSHITSLQDTINGTLWVNLAYTYDADGRRSAVNYAFNPPAAMSATYSANNQIATYNGTGVGTDADGHITADPSSGNNFTWSDGALTTIGNPSLASDMYPGYDQLGRRNSEGFVTPCSSVYPQSTYVLYDGQVPVEEQYNEVASDCASYWAPFSLQENMLSIPGSGEVLALTDPSGNNLVPLHDSLGSTLWMVNSSGQMQTTFTYTPFGAPSQSGTQSNYPYLFTGREWSDIGGVSQQYYTWARPYSPGLHRFIAPDPIGFAGSGTNLYAYVGNDPIDLSDPTGLSGFFAWVGELFTGTAFNADITPALCAGSGFFACAAAIGIAAVTVAVTGYELSGGGGHASLPSAPPALLGAQLAQQLARHGFTPQYNSYDRPSPGTHFDPNQLRPVSDPRPYPNGRTGQQQNLSRRGPTPFNQGRFRNCLANQAGYGTLVPDALTCVGGAAICAYVPSPYSCGPALLGCLATAGEIFGCYNQAISGQGALGQ